MNTFFIVATLAMLAAVQALTGQQKEKVMNHDTECIKDTGVDEKLVKKIHEGDWTSEDPKLKSFTFCMLRKSGLMTEDGKIHKDIALSKTDPKKKEIVGKAIDKCIGKIGSNKDETAWNYSKCYNAEKPEHA